jgi:large repetitive protein
VFAHVDFQSPPQPVTHVTNYHFAEGDTFDFSALTSQFHASGVSDDLIVRAVEDSSGQFATLQINNINPNLPGAANWVSIAQIDGAHAGDDIRVTVDSHSAVHLAQIHVGLLV